MQADKSRVKGYILQLMQRGDKGVVKKVADTFEIPKSTIYKYVNELAGDGVIEKRGREDYCLICKKYEFHYHNDGTLGEDRIFEQDINGLLKNTVTDEAYRIWRYVFTEMMNNAIEHSEATDIFCRMTVNGHMTAIVIADNGIGIFNNVIRYAKNVKNMDITVDDAIRMLLPGKFTTNKEAHSGEGIFFSSRMVDDFVVFSDNKMLLHSAFRENVADDMSGLHNGAGTTVFMRLHNQSKRQISEIFNQYSDVNTGEFYKTQIPVANVFSMYPVSRSEARRLCAMFDDFSTVELDFSNVEEIGQAFAHEVFAVYQSKNPQKKIEYTNAGEKVLFMIKRALAH